MKLFLVVFDLITNQYMGDKITESNILRLVKAEDETEARRKVTDRYEYFSHGGDSVTVEINDVSDCIE